MERFVLESEDVRAVFRSRQFADGWLQSYALELEAPDFHASTRVENPGYGHPPSQLFQELATHWSGWSGPKVWRAMEGELEIAATSDSVGHIKFELKVPTYSEASHWSASAWVVVEAGQLERLAREAQAFFNAGA